MKTLRCPGLMDCVAILQPRQALVLGERTLETLCALIRLGCAAATELQPGERPDPATADLVVARAPERDDAVDHLLAQARQALIPGSGRIVLQMQGARLEDRMGHAVERAREAGFAELRIQMDADTAMLSAKAPPRTRAAAPVAPAWVHGGAHA